MAFGLAAVCALLLAGGEPGIAADGSWQRYLAIDGATDTQSALRDALLTEQLASQTQDQLLSFYQARDFKPVWTGSEQARARAENVRAALDHAGEQGLESADYLPSLSKWKNAPEEGPDAAQYDVAMTAALLRYANDVRSGRFDPGEVYRDVRLPAQKFDAVAALTTALKRDDIDDFLSNLPPPNPSYRALVAALAHYRAIEAQGGWPIIPGASKIALEGKGKRVQLLKKRLALEDPEFAEKSDPSTEDLQAAVMRFERRNGLNDDGVVGPDVLKELNVPVSHRVQQIIANMERWRWMPRTMERNYILVNVPDETVDFIRDGESVLHSRVVVGMKDNQTPILRTEAVAVIANPPWNIPSDIVAKSILPKLRENADYLATRNMVLTDGPADDPHGTTVDWQDISANKITYRFQQTPRPDNVLGSLMLDMPNPFDVYMHDTPNKELFLADTRENSHGCVRVEQILPLASLALTGDANDGTEEINDAIATGQTQRLKLSEPLPVYLLYWTAVPDKDGTIGFRPDRYDRDRDLIAKLSRPS